MYRKEIVYIGFAFDHHLKTHSGYHHIAEYGDYDYIIDTQGFMKDGVIHPRISLRRYEIR